MFSPLRGALLAALFSLLLVPGVALADFAESSATPEEYGESVIAARLAAAAESVVGAPYAWGGSSPAGFDCSGLVTWVYRELGIALPRTADGQLTAGETIPSEELAPGDIVVFANTYMWGPSHSGIYVGEGQFVHAVDSAHGVTVSSIFDAYWSPRFVAGVRVR